MASIDPHLAEKIVHEVKSQGVFDEFRKDSIADVDTKPAYQNLRQRVENAVQKFLTEQKWTPETNKYQLREKLRRHIAESGFLDVGVERIVDQVVNPKIGSVFHPRIEEITYKFLGIPPPAPIKRELPPPPPALPPLPPYPMNGNALKIETETPITLLPTDLEQVSPDSDKPDIKEEDSNDATGLDDKVDDDDESPPFEPLTECKSPIKTEADTKASNENSQKEIEIKPSLEINLSPPPPPDDIASAIEARKSQTSTPVKDENTSIDGLASQESQLSQVSSDSRISSTSNQINPSGSDNPTALESAANISEEAQMPKFNENSTETEGNSKNNIELHFDINKDEIKFEGTERKSNILDGDQPENVKDAPVIKETFISDSVEMKGSFHFTKLNVEVEACNTTQEGVNSVSSQDDTSSAQLCIVERSENELQVDTNSVQKGAPLEESSTTNIINSQPKQSEEKKYRIGKQSSASSSSSSSRHKKSSSKDKNRRSPDRHKHREEKERDREDKDRDREDKDRDRDRSKHRDRYSDSKHSSSKTSGSRKHQSSSDRHSYSSKRSEKVHRSSSSRSESHSRHDSLKRDHRDKHDQSKKQTSLSNKEQRSDGHKSRDDHNESRDKLRWRKSTDSNDEDKSPGGNGTSNGNNYPVPQVKTTAETETTTPVNSKGNNNDTTKHSTSTKQSASFDSEPTKTTKVDTSMVVILNDVLENPATKFIDLESKSRIQVCTTKDVRRTSTEIENDLLYFEQISVENQSRQDALQDAIDRCRFLIKQTTDHILQHDEDRSSEEFSPIKSNPHAERSENDTELGFQQETKATLVVDCFHYNECSDRKSRIDSDSSEESTPKRLKLNTEGMPTMINGSTKENQMNEKNAVITAEETSKKQTLTKRNDAMAKLSQQQRYSSEDLYKPRPVLGQRSKRRGLDTVI